MQIVLKHQLKTTRCLIFRPLSTLLKPNSFLDINFTSLGNVSPLDDHKENHLQLIDLDLLVQLQHGSHGSVCNSYALNKLISSCATSRSLYTGIQIHSFVFKLGFCSHVYISTALVDMYGKCGVISDAHKLFDETPHRNVITWNSLISGYLHTHYVDFSLDLFVAMLRLGIYPTHFTISTVLVGCSQLETLELGEQLHGLSTKFGFLYNIVVCTSLLEMYWKCSKLDDSRRIFEDMPCKNLVSWTSMITGYTQNQQTKMAMYIFKKMLDSVHKADSIAYNTLLSSFSNPEDMIHCEQIHCSIIKQGLDSDVYLSVTLVTVYSKCSNSLQDFQKICATLPLRNKITCNAIISGFANMGNGEKALGFFSEMRQAGIDTDFFTISTVLKVIGVMSVFKEGKQLHGLIVKQAFNSNIYIQNALISMYAKCGNIHEAKRMFTSMMVHDTVSWNSLLSGYAQHGYGSEAVELFEQMRKTKVKPDLTTFLIVISACGHVGLVNKGLEYFELMRNYGSPKVEHYACIVDLYGRAGFLDEAEMFVDNMGMEAGPAVYKALLSACRVYGNKEMGMRLSRKIVGLFPDDSGVYVQVSSILASGGFWDDSFKAHSVMCSKGIKKKVGCSWI
ncbi:hypothetical protein L2E82_20726 [Cichorium intybus]|uniref:Uncharacterized protein n=1 Tax=Cichorium intybus TaxID=13427 RepID=A0ACB9DV45_CICIN|nr:hypothetical protein L2E82_20726 [Cichorium intybus]